MKALTIILVSMMASPAMAGIGVATTELPKSEKPKAKIIRRDGGSTYRPGLKIYPKGYKNPQWVNNEERDSNNGNVVHRVGSPTLRVLGDDIPRSKWQNSKLTPEPVKLKVRYADLVAEAVDVERFFSLADSGKITDPAKALAMSLKPIAIDGSEFSIPPEELRDVADKLLIERLNERYKKLDRILYSKRIIKPEDNLNLSASAIELTLIPAHVRDSLTASEASTYHEDYRTFYAKSLSSVDRESKKAPTLTERVRLAVDYVSTHIGDVVDNVRAMGSNR